MALNAAAESALDTALGLEAPKPAASKKHKSLAAALDAALDAPRLEPYREPSALENLKNLPKLVTEGLPRAYRAFEESQQGPTYGQALAQRFPSVARYTPIPGAMDLLARLTRLPSSVGRGMAELGPERAKPLTEELVSGLLNLSPLFQRSRAPRPQTVGELPPEYPALPSAERRALPPAPQPRPYPGPGRPRAAYVVFDPNAPIPVGPHPPEALPAGPSPRALPPMGPRGGRPMGPGEPGAGPVRNLRAEIEERLRQARAARTGAYQPERPLEVRTTARQAAADLGAPLEGEILDQYGRPIDIPGRTMSERERLRRLYKGRLGERRDITSPTPPGAQPEATAPARTRLEEALDRAVAPKPEPIAPKATVEPAAPRFENTPIGEQAVMDVGGRTVPKGPIRAKAPQADIQDTALFGQERAARERAMSEAQGTLGGEVREATSVGPPVTEGVSAQDAARNLESARIRYQNALEDLDRLKQRAGELPEDMAERARVRYQGAADRALQDIELYKDLKAAAETEDYKPLASKLRARAVSAGGSPPPEAADPQRAALQEWLTDQLGSGAAMSLAQAKSPKTLPPAVKAKLQGLGIDPNDAWDLTHADSPRVDTVQRLLARSLAEGKELPPKRPGFKFSQKGFEDGAPNLSDPDDVYKIIQAAGRIKTTEDLTGELRDVSGFFKSKKGRTLDEIAAGLEEEYPHLGDRGEIREKLIDTLRRYQALRADKQAKAMRVPSPEEGMHTEMRMSTPPKDVPIAPEEWRDMDVLQRKAAMDFFRDAFTDESGKLDLQKMVDALKRFRNKFPEEGRVRVARPNSPVISEVERWSVGLADGLQRIAEMLWWKPLRNMNPEVLKDTEETMVREWLRRLPPTIRAAMRDPDHTWTASEIALQRQMRDQVITQFAPPELQAYMRHRDAALARENRSRQFFGLDPIPEEVGPYLPRRTKAESREAVSLGGGQLGVGRGLQTTVRGHQQGRVFETYRQGEAGGIEYEDPRNAIFLREWEGLKLRATHRLFRNLEAKGGLYRDVASARRASMNQRPWAVENAPGGTWYTPTEAEAKFMQQNLTESGKGSLGSLVGYANGLARNPQLVNPSPHVLKNMGFKLLLARGPVTPYVAVRDAIEWAKGANPQLLREFNEAMPFSASGHTAPEILGRQLRDQGIKEAVRTGMRWVGTVNRPSQKVIFEWADPAMRYSLYKHYRQQGMGVYEAGNHAWQDLIRYGTRSDRIDFWKSIPLNFFVPWRYGTVVSLFKQIRQHPVRTAALIGAIEYLREARYRATGKWTHLPIDYAEKPLAQLLQDRNPADLAAVLGTTALFGPGGDFSAKQLGDLFQALQGKPGAVEQDKIKNMFWGLAQIYNLPQEYERGDYAGMLATILLGEHNALTYQPRRLAKDLPEWLPLMQRSEAVRIAEDLQALKKQRQETAAEKRAQKPRSTIEDKLRAGGYIP